MIPKSFKLQAHTIKVKFDNKYLNPKDYYGLARYATNEILLADENRDNKIDPTQIEHCFYHEMIHHILNCMGEDELNANEKFVDSLAGHLHQCLSTMKYPNGKKVKNNNSESTKE